MGTQSEVSMAEMASHNEQPAAPPLEMPPGPGNPGPLGFFSLATTTLLVGLLLIGARDVPNITMCIGQCAIVGGVGMLISGILCYQQGATFATTAFAMYGLFYISLGVVLYPSAGVTAAYTEITDYNSALGLYLIVWFVLSLVMWPTTWRLNVGLAVLFTLVVFYFLFLAIGFMMSHATIIKVGGYFGILVGCWGYILGMQSLYETEKGLFQFPNPTLVRK